MKFIKKYLPCLICGTILGLAITFTMRWLNKQMEYTENRYALEEIESGIYAEYYHVSSAAPADNYDVVEICVDGNIRTYSGDVSINYTNQKPYAVIMTNNLVRSDKVFLYVPKGTVDFKESVGVR